MAKKLLSIVSPKPQQPVALTEAVQAPLKTTTDQLAPQPADDGPYMGRRNLRQFRIDIGDSGYGSGLNIPT